MLDLSAAFDVIDHSILVKRLKFSYGIGGDALAWIESYLTNRHQRVAVLSSTSADFQLNYGVPQGSVLGPKLYCMFSKPRLGAFKNCKINFDGQIIDATSCVRNLGVLFDRMLTLDDQISSISKQCFYQLRNIGRIRKLISENACKTLVCTLVTSRLDYGNALLYGLGSSSLSKLHRIKKNSCQNDNKNQEA